MRHRLIALAATLLLAGCATGIDSAVFMQAAPLPPDDEVRVHQTTVPACEYDEVGVVMWRPTSGWQKLEKGVQLMRERARQMGGHAIISFRIGEQTVGSTSTAARPDSTTVTVSTSVDSQTLATGTVIRFRDVNCASGAGTAAENRPD